MMNITSNKLRSLFLDYFMKNGHKIIPSSSLIPDDPSVLLTTAGMQQFKPYFTGDADAFKDFGSLNVASIQKSFRTSDIDIIGDNTHLTFFEMMGNFSFGGYFKEDSVRYAYDFLTDVLDLKISYVSIFKGSGSISFDKQTEKIWRSYDITNIKKEGMEEVFWGPTGSSGPCGPTTEIYIKSKGGNDVEIWNIVFNEYFFNGSRDELLSNSSPKSLEKAGTAGVDTGMGFERLLMIMQNKDNIFDTDLFMPIMDYFSALSLRDKRIISDHIRAICFLISDGVLPSNNERGYILRRLIRRAITILKRNSLSIIKFTGAIDIVEQIYGEHYKQISDDSDKIKETINLEYDKFGAALSRGLKIFKSTSKRKTVDAKDAFELYQSYGFPFDITRELAREINIDISKEDFDKEMREHKTKSKAGLEKKFGGHGLILDTGELKAANKEELSNVIRLHTATHLLHAALRKVLGDDVKQMGSDITSKRTRFDFAYPRKLTAEEIKQVENLINKVIKTGYSVKKEEMLYENAVKMGFLHFFKEKYPDQVTVYTIENVSSGDVFSKELCRGPHVGNTAEIGEFSIIKEESSSAGVRRIRANISNA